MKAMRATLDNGTQLELTRDSLKSPAPFGVLWQGEHSLVLYALDHTLTLTLRDRRQAYASAAMAGAALEQHACAVPVALYLLLAYVARTQTLPEMGVTERILAVASFLDPQPATLQLTEAEIRERAALALGQHENEFLLPEVEGSWNLARFLLRCGELAWQLCGERAWFWGSYPMGVTWEQSDQAKSMRGWFSKLAAIMFSPKMGRYLSMPLCACPVLEFAWWDQMALSTGRGRPDCALRPGGGLGEYHGSVFEANPDPYYLGLTLAHAQALQAVASALLCERERPYPRYMGRVLEVRLPLQLFPRLQKWGIERLLVQVEATGLYISVLDEHGSCIGASWWEASSLSDERCPMNFPEQCGLCSTLCVPRFGKMPAQTLLRSIQSLPLQER
jgi:hypothetical protein